MNSITAKLTINNKELILSSAPNRTLLDVLREDLGLTGVKDACGGEGECGACTVIIDGKAVNSCLVLIGQVDGCRIETIEGLSEGNKLHPLQKSYIEAGAVQCGFCTPGAILSSKALLDQTPDPTDDEIREALSGNLCRCTGYTKMIEAARLASKEINHD
jgi:aerobic-type carbon monoxide dehydrogenase small subunit (CoxS/CutS family)